MKCPFCNSEIADHSSFCSHCGRMQNNDPVDLSYRVPQNVSNQTNWWAVAGLVLAFLMPVLGLIFSILGYSKFKEIQTGKGLALAGIIVSIVEIVLIVLVYVIAAVFLASIYPYIYPY